MSYYYSGVLETLSIDELDDKLNTMTKSGTYGNFFKIHEL